MCVYKKILFLYKCFSFKLILRHLKFKIKAYNLNYKLLNNKYESMAQLQPVNLAVAVYFTGSREEETSETHAHITLGVHMPLVK